MVRTCRTCGFEEALDAFDVYYCSLRCRTLGCRVDQREPDVENHNVSSVQRNLTPLEVDAYVEWVRDASLMSAPIGCQWFLGPQDANGTIGIYATASLSAGVVLAKNPSEQLLQPLVPFLPVFARRGMPQPLQWLDVLQGDASTHQTIHRLATMRSGLLSQGGNDKALVMPWSLCAHSCSPSLTVRADGAVVAARLVAKGEQLTISRLRPVELRMSASVRQELLSVSCGLPTLCGCTRCEEGLDDARGIRCGCGGTRKRRKTGGSEAWRCDRCADSWSDADMRHTNEERLSEAAYRLWLKMRDVDSGAAKLTKTTFKDFRESATNVQEALGDGHWCSILVAETAVHFYKAFMRTFADDTKAEAQRLITQWGTRWLLLARCQKFLDAAPVECAQYLQGVADVVTDPALFVPRYELLHAVCDLMPAAREEQRQLPPIRSVGGRLLLSCDAEANLVAPSELLDQWEHFLVAKVSTAAQSSASYNGLVTSLLHHQPTQ